MSDMDEGDAPCNILVTYKMHGSDHLHELGPYTEKQRDFWRSQIEQIEGAHSILARVMTKEEADVRIRTVLSRHVPFQLTELDLRNCTFDLRPLLETAPTELRGDALGRGWLEQMAKPGFSGEMKTKHVRIPNGTRVRTQEAPGVTTNWDEGMRDSCRYDLRGKVLDCSDAHGLCYLIQHDDLTQAWYDPAELSLLVEDAWNTVDKQGLPLCTRSGREFYVLAPCADDVFIEDIAHHLSNLCRFAGAVQEFYSVGEHSVRGAMALAEAGCSVHAQLAFLLHDAAEAYVVDLPRPLKDLLPEYARIENDISRVIYEKYDCALDLRTVSIVQIMDRRMLSTERRDLMPAMTDSWPDMPTPLPEKIWPWSPRATKRAYLNLFHKLTNNKYTQEK